ncbi:MAG: BrnA antitoxin family protein [Sphingomonas sp.]|nr:BrnA antitoxin family protein [Sphingomonas sp.]
MLSSVIHVRVPAKLVLPIRAEASARDISVSELIREAIKRELAEGGRVQ